MRQRSILSFFILCVLPWWIYAQNVLPTYEYSNVRPLSVIESDIDQFDSCIIQIVHPYRNVDKNTPYWNYVSQEEVTFRLEYTLDSLSQVKDNYWDVTSVGYLRGLPSDSIYLMDTLSIFNEALDSRYTDQITFELDTNATDTIFQLVIKEIERNPHAGGTVPEDILGELMYNTQRNDNLLLGIPPSLSYMDLGDCVRLEWDLTLGAEYYELEYSFYDAYETVPQGEEFARRVRIETGEPSYIITKTYPQGILYARVRAVSNILDPTFNRNIYMFGVWTETATIPINQDFQDQHNWKVSKTFAEEGKKKENVMYYDDTYRERQSVVSLNTEHTYLISETDYDAEGREALKIIPTPDYLDRKLEYREDYNATTFGTEYSYLNFDKMTADPLLHLTGSSRYYSPSNNTDGIYRDYIPNANHFPLIHTKYKRDNTGRVTHQGGVGAEFQIGSGHETKHYYATPSQTELARLFGCEIGDASHYRKNLTIDANGQTSVSYEDIYGNVVATGLSGQSPNNVISLGNYPTVQQTQELNTGSANGVEPVVSYNTILNEGVTNYAFHYDLLDKELMFGPGTCLKCIYEVELYIEDECGNLIDFSYSIPQGPFSENYSGNVLTVQFGLPTPQDYACDGVQTLYKVDISATFNDFGEYTIFKKMSIGGHSEETLVEIAENSVDENEIIQLVKERIDTLRCLDDCMDYCEYLVTKSILENEEYTEDDREALMIACQNNVCDKAGIDIFGEVSSLDCENHLNRIKAQLGRRRPESWDEWTDEYEKVFIDNTCYQSKEIPIEDVDGLVWTCKEDPGGGSFNLLDQNGDLVTSDLTITLQCGLTVSVTAGVGAWPQITTMLSSLECWQDPWADVLAECHREYCYIAHCSDWVGTRTFGFEVSLIKTWEELNDKYCSGNCYNPTYTNQDIPVFVQNMIDALWTQDKNQNFVNMTDCANVVEGLMASYVDDLHDDFKADVIAGISGLNLPSGMSQFAEYITFVIIEDNLRLNDWVDILVSSLNQIKEEAFWDCWEGCPDENQKDEYILFNRPNFHKDESRMELFNWTKQQNDGSTQRYCEEQVESWQTTYIAEIDPNGMPPIIQGALSDLCAEVCLPFQMVGCYEENECPLDSIPIVDYCTDKLVKTLDDNSGTPGQESAQILYHQQSASLSPATLPLPNFVPSEFVPPNVKDQYLFAFRVKPNEINGRKDEWHQKVRITVVPNICSVQEIGAPPSNDLMNIARGLRVAIYPVECENNEVQYFGSCINHIREMNANIYYNYFGGITIEWSEELNSEGSVDCNDRDYVLHFYRTTDFDDEIDVDFVFEINADFNNDHSLIQSHENHVKKPVLTNIYNDLLDLYPPQPGKNQPNEIIKTLWDCEKNCEELSTCYNNVIASFSALSLLDQPSGCVSDIFTSETECGFDLATSTMYACDDQARQSLFIYNQSNSPFDGKVFILVNEYGSIIDLHRTEILDWAYTKVPVEWILRQDGFITGNNYTHTKVLLHSITNKNIVDGGGQEPYCEALPDEHYLHVGYLFFRGIVDPSEELDIVNDLDCHPTFDKEDCDDELQRQIEEEFQRAYAKRVNEEIDKLKKRYEECVFDEQENLYVTFDKREYQYTLYYYDQAGNLIRTVPPKGVHPLGTGFFDNKGKMTTANAVPNHSMVTTYDYNSYDNVTSSTTPDAGTMAYHYDHAQRLRLTVDAQQNNQNRATYNKYDDLNRVIETGSVLEIDPSESNLNNKEYPTGNVEQYYLHFYDDVGDATLPANMPIDQENLRGRMAYSEYHANPSTDNVLELAYSYDEHGNVGRYAMYQENIGWKYMTYDYDLISGNVLQFSLQPDEPDQYYTKYMYDADNRLERVFTSVNGRLWDHDARYFYYMHGPLARMELGHELVQGVDYIYTLQGWIKAVNMPGVQSHDFEPGHDGADEVAFTDNLNFLIGRDVFGYGLGYYQNNDYLPIDNTVNMGSLPSAWNGFGANILGPSGEKGLFNGNIAWMVTDLKTFEIAGENLNGMAYQYDQLHRIKQARSYSYEASQWFSRPLANSYNTEYSYDKNGNITSLDRYGSDGMMDDFSYLYLPANTNKLFNIDDDQTNNGRYAHDFDDDGTYEYTYDLRGNLVQDNNTNIYWYDFGKVSRVQGGGVNNRYQYDSGGNRSVKRKVGSGSNPNVNSVYVRDPSGNVVSIYREEDGQVDQLEIPLYGSSRLGVHKINREDIGVVVPSIELNRVEKHYELANYLQNTLATVSDRKFYVYQNKLLQYGQAEVVTSQDYYPFGMEMMGSSDLYNPTNTDEYSGRVYHNKSLTDRNFRYGFNGKEKDDAFHDDITNYDYGFRIYNPGISRFLSVDPLTRDYPMLTPYQFAENAPITSIDLDGLESYVATDGSVIGAGPLNHGAMLKEGLTPLPQFEGGYSNTGPTLAERGSNALALKMLGNTYSGPSDQLKQRVYVKDFGRQVAEQLVTSIPVAAEELAEVPALIFYTAKGAVTGDFTDAGYQAAATFLPGVTKTGISTISKGAKAAFRKAKQINGLSISVQPSKVFLPFQKLPKELKDAIPKLDDRNIALYKFDVKDASGDVIENIYIRHDKSAKYGDGGVGDQPEHFNVIRKNVNGKYQDTGQHHNIEQ